MTTAPDLDEPLIGIGDDWYYANRRTVGGRKLVRDSYGLSAKYNLPQEVDQPPSSASILAQEEPDWLAYEAAVERELRVLAFAMMGLPAFAEPLIEQDN